MSSRHDAVLSVVVPAHDEALVIDRCLESITSHRDIDRFDIVVVANGCSDDTADRARRHGPNVRVVERAAASKANALNDGDDAVTAYPRFFVDADVRLGPEALTRTAAFMAERSLLAATPLPVFDVGSYGAVARLYHRAWRTSPYFTAPALGGAGVLGLSAAGRARFDRFPDIYADDAFVDSLFTEGEKGRAPDAWCAPVLPGTAAEIVRVRRRQLAARLELRAYQSSRGVEAPSLGSSRGWIVRSLEQPRLWAPMVTFVGLNTVAEVLGRRDARRGLDGRWAKDGRSRAAMGRRP